MSIEQTTEPDKKTLFLLDWKKQKDQSHDFMLGYQNGWSDGYDALLARTRWRSVEKDGLPERKPNTTYSQVPCIVIRDGHPEMLVFNHEHECWDDATGDDFDCKPDEVEAWMPIPTFEGEK